nr:hypothetical protein [Tanacetum cinerariifolium]
MVKALLLDKKSQNQAHATVKGVEKCCVTCGGAHSYRNCPAIDGNVYRDNFQEFISQASAVNYNQGDTNYRPSMISNQIRPPGFPPIKDSGLIPAIDKLVCKFGSKSSPLIMLEIRGASFSRDQHVVEEEESVYPVGFVVKRWRKLEYKKWAGKNYVGATVVSNWDGEGVVIWVFTFLVLEVNKD